MEGPWKLPKESPSCAQLSGPPQQGRWWWKRKQLQRKWSPLWGSCITQPTPHPPHTHMPPPPPPPTSTHCCLLGRRQDQELMLPRPRPPEGHVRAYIPISSCFLDAHTVPLTAPSTLWTPYLPRGHAAPTHLLNIKWRPVPGPRDASKMWVRRCWILAVFRPIKVTVLWEVWPWVPGTSMVICPYNSCYNCF